MRARGTVILAVATVAAVTASLAVQGPTQADSDRGSRPGNNQAVRTRDANDGHRLMDDRPQQPEVWQQPLRRPGSVARRPPDTDHGPRTSSRVPSAAASATAPALYDVVVLGLDTPAGPHGTDAAESAAVVARLDAEYNRETGGAYRFRFSSFRALPAAAMTTCGVSAMATTYHSQIEAAVANRPTTGATDVIWVIVTTGQPCDYAGQGFLGAAGVHMNGYWEAVGPTVEPLPGATSIGPKLDVRILAHEVGHNLGLRHAAGSYSNGTTSPLTTANFRGYDEYGDVSDTMGNNDYTMRLSGYFRDVLGLVPPDATAAAMSPSQTYTLSPIDAASGIRMITVPDADSRAYTIEFRPGVGQDWPLRFTPYSGGPGVYVRSADAFPESSPAADFLSYRPFGSLALPSSYEDADPTYIATRRTGLLPGESMNLPHGITVTIGSVSDLAATVTVTRPADTLAPQVPVNPCANLPATSPDGCYTQSIGPVTITAFPSFAPDDVWTRSLTLAVDGAAAGRWDLGSANVPYAAAVQHYEELDGYLKTPSGEPTYPAFTLPLGTHTVSATVADAAGNASTRTWTIENRLLPTDADPDPDPDPESFHRPSAPGTPRLTKARRARLVMRWTYPFDDGGSVVDDYRIQCRVNRGRWRTLVDGVSASPRLTLGGLRQHRTYRFRVSAHTDIGWGPFTTAVRLRTR